VHAALGLDGVHAAFGLDGAHAMLGGKTGWERVGYRRCVTEPE